MNTINLYSSTIAILLLLSGSLQSAIVNDQPYNDVGFYIENFGGSVDPVTVPHVYDVFMKVRAVAEVNHRDLPQLVIIKDLPGPPAIVLSDGYIVLAERALDVVYNAVPISEGNARLAFVIGHELAHLANDDFWNAEAEHLIRSKALSGAIDRALLDQLRQDNEDLINKELQADDKGFLYAAMAGFPVEKLLAPESDFLGYWVGETNTQSSPMHPQAAHRTELLRERLKKTIENLEFFHMGVRLVHFGRYQDAVYFFREFLNVFPGREVFNNLGICYLQMAVKKLPPKQAYQYWFPSVLDNETIIRQTEAFPIFRDRNQIRIAKEFLNKAVEYFEKATQKDPEYVIGFINLAVACFYVDEIYRARAAIEKARQLKPDDYEIESLRALILYEEGKPIDTWSHAEEIFDGLNKRYSADALPSAFYYNWARLLEERGRFSESQWQHLESRKRELPRPIANMLCERFKEPSAVKRCLEEVNIFATDSGPVFSETLPIRPGFDAWKLKKGAHPLKRWERLPFNWQGDAASSGAIYYSPQKGVVLEMDGVVEMVVLRQNTLQLTQLQKKYGPPRHKKPLMNNELWLYGQFAVLIEQGKVKEIWVVVEQLSLKE